MSSVRANVGCGDGVRGVRRFYFARRSSKVTIADFPSVWRSHSDLLQTMPSLANRFAGYTYALIGRSFNTGPDQRPHDGIGAFWLAPHLASLDEAERQRQFLVADPEGSLRMRADEERVFARPVASDALTADEHVVRDLPTTTDCLYLLTRPSQESGERVLVERLRDALVEIVNDSTFAPMVARVAFNHTSHGTSSVSSVGEIWIRPGLTPPQLESWAEQATERLLGPDRPREVTGYLASACHSHGLESVTGSGG